MKKYQESLFFGVFFVIALLIRLYGLGKCDLWYDEVGTIRYVYHPLQNWNAPLYYVILHFWTKIVEISEFSLRFPSVVFSLGAVVFEYLLGKDLFGTKTGALAGFFMIFSPFHLWYAQEARDYSMMLFLGTAASYFLFSALKKQKYISWILFVFISLAGMYTNYFYIFLFFAQIVVWIYYKKRRLTIREIVSFLFVLVGFSLYVRHLFSKFSFVREGFWVPQPAANAFIITLENFLLGYNGIPLLYFLSSLFMGICLIFALRAIHKNVCIRTAAIMCSLLCFLPLIIVFIFSKIFFSIYLDRAFIILSPYYYFIVAFGIKGITPRILKLSMIAVLFSLIFISGYAYFRQWMFMPFSHHVGVSIKKPVRPIAEFLDNHCDSESIVGFTNDSIIPPLACYMQKKIVFYSFFDPRVPDSNSKRFLEESKYAVPFYKITLLPASKIWVLVYSWTRDEWMDDNTQSVKTWLDRNFIVEHVTYLEGVSIVRYGRKKS